MPINTNTPTGRSCRAWNGRAEGRVNVVPKMIHLTVHPKERSETETQFRGSYDRPNLSETFQSSGFGGCLAWTAFRNAVQAWSELWSGFSTTTLSIYAIYVYLVRFACILESRTRESCLGYRRFEESMPLRTLEGRRQSKDLTKCHPHLFFGASVELPSKSFSPKSVDIPGTSCMVQGIHKR